eukprot:267367_1
MTDHLKTFKSASYPLNTMPRKKRTLKQIEPTELSHTYFLFATHPNPHNTKWIHYTNTVSTNIKPSTEMMLHSISMYPKAISKRCIDLWSKMGPHTPVISTDHCFYHYELYGHQNVKIPSEEEINNNDIDYNKYWIINFLRYKMYSSEYHEQYQKYQQYLFKVFQKYTFKSQYHLNHNYTLFIHCVTNPNGPQIWRKVSLNGRLTLQQVDQLLQLIIGYGFTGINHMTEFRINFNNNKLTNKIGLEFLKDHLETWNIRNELVIFDTKLIDKSSDGIVYRNIRANCSVPINKIYFGQIAELFLNKQSLYTNNTKPFDPFYDKYYSNLYTKSSNGQEYKFIDAKHNFSFNRNDCFQYVYDWGEEWIYNIYVIDKQTNEKDNIWSALIDGQTWCPPNDISAMEAYKWCLTKCHYDPQGLQIEVGDYKSPDDVYNWMEKTSKTYYDYQCLMTQNGYSMRKYLIENFKVNNSINIKERNKIINRLKSN